MSNYILSTERLGLRRWLQSDIHPFADMNKDVDVMRFFPKTLTTSETLEMVQRIDSHFAKNGFGLFAVEDKSTKEFVGFTGFSIPTFDAFFTPCIEIGWRYRKEVWGRGFATEAANACLNYGFDVLNFDKIVSFTSKINLNSEKVMRRIGMSYVAEFDHPKLEPNSLLNPHILYEIKSKHV